MAAIGPGLVEPGTSWARVDTVVEPDPSTRATYDELYALYGSLYPATREHVHALARMQEDGVPATQGSPG